MDDDRIMTMFLKISIHYDFEIFPSETLLNALQITVLNIKHSIMCFSVLLEGSGESHESEKVNILKTVVKSIEAPLQHP